MGGCPSPPAEQRDLGVDEAGRVGDQQAEPPAADSVQWRPIWIDRGRCAIRAVRPGYASPSFRALTGRPLAHELPPWSPSHGLLTGRRPRLNASALGTATLRWKFGFAARGIELPQWVGRCCCNHPRVPPSAAASALFCSALMPGRPARGRRSQTSTRPTLLRSQPNTRGVPETAFGYAHNALALSVRPLQAHKLKRRRTRTSE